MHPEMIMTIARQRSADRAAAASFASGRTGHRRSSGPTRGR
jgi:hypothetical protein